jgi:hypothetical protein
MRTLHLTALAALVVSQAAVAQVEIDPAHRFAWGENTGWTNWRDAGDPAASQGVRVHASFLSGFVWGENVGWIHVGSGTPADGVRYSNLDASDFGVNVDGNGDLFGLAWGENIGWIQFDTRSKGEQRARFDRAARRFRGFVWGENVGWINLDDPEQFVGTLPDGTLVVFVRGDANASGDIDISDAIHTLGCLFLGSACTECPDAGDANDDGDYDLADAVFILRWLFRGGAPPPPPGPETCGPDPTADPFEDCGFAGCA